jgi:stearoyl-CoA desaturase (delta-9 desaturase)
MAPRNIGSDVIALSDEDIKNDQLSADITSEDAHPEKKAPLDIKWSNVVRLAILHLIAVYGAYCVPSAQPLTWLWSIFLYFLGALGITAGAHRLWSHRSYKAKLPLKIFLAICNTIAFQNDIIDWSRDHRVHHKYSETNADPHDATRGFFFAHVGWLMCRKQPEVKEKSKNVDFSDLFADPVLVFQRKVYYPSVLLLCFIIPTVVPWYYWDESLLNAYVVSGVLRYVINLNATWCVNSLAHMWGNRPYNRKISPVENFFVTFGAIGEGFHNYHHTFPSDYSTSEYGWKLNLTTAFIDLMAKIGQAENRKKMSHDLIMKRRLRTGDGSSGFGLVDRPKKE